MSLPDSHIIVIDAFDILKKTFSKPLATAGFILSHAISEQEALLQLIDILQKPVLKNITILISHGALASSSYGFVTKARNLASAYRQDIYCIIIRTDPAQPTIPELQHTVDAFVTANTPKAVLTEIALGIQQMLAKKALENVSLHIDSLRDSQILQMHNEVVGRFFCALQSKYGETGAHVRRITVMSVFLAKLLGWEQKRIDFLQAAAPLHDIGKLGISKNILLKPNALSPSEQETVRKHTTIGSTLLTGPANPFLQTAAKIALYHHENWDGSGYPTKLTGESIPIEARIISIVDVYDSLRSSRVYRKAMDEKKVLAIMAKERGVKFDPALLDIFTQNVETINELFSHPDLVDDDIC